MNKSHTTEFLLFNYYLPNCLLFFTKCVANADFFHTLLIQNTWNPLEVHIVFVLPPPLPTTLHPTIESNMSDILLLY